MEKTDKEKIYTTDFIEALPDGVRAELFDGRIYYMDMPGTLHQKILSFLLRTIGKYVDVNDLQCEVMPIPFVIYLNNDKNTCVVPDISVICDLSKLGEYGCYGAPDWIIEIVSPSSKTMDYYRKLLYYSNAGVREYWVVNPEERIVVVIKGKEEVKEYTFDDNIPVGIFEGFSIKIEV